MSTPKTKFVPQVFRYLDSEKARRIALVFRRGRLHYHAVVATHDAIRLVRAVEGARDLEQVVRLDPSVALDGARGQDADLEDQLGAAHELLEIHPQGGTGLDAGATRETGPAEQREDRQTEIRIELERRLDDQTTLVPQLIGTRNASTLSPNDFRRLQAGLLLRHRF